MNSGDPWQTAQADLRLASDPIGISRNPVRIRGRAAGYRDGSTVITLTPSTSIRSAIVGSSECGAKSTARLKAMASSSVAERGVSLEVKLKIGMPPEVRVAKSN
jgi:hypothetical protein